MIDRGYYSAKCLKSITDLFEENNIKYWLEFGTLLGSYREGKIIDIDYDMDIGVFNHDSDKVKKLLEGKIDENKFNKLPLAKWIDNKVYQIDFHTFENVKPLWLDVYFFDIKDNYAYSSFLTKDNDVLKCKSNLRQLNNLEKIKLYDDFFYCPNTVPLYLKVRYGDNFYKKQSYCEKFNKQWDSVDDNIGNEYLDVV